MPPWRADERLARDACSISGRIFPRSRRSTIGTRGTHRRAWRARHGAEICRAIITFCEQLDRFLQRGVPREDLLVGLRLTHYRGSTAIAYRITEEQVAVLGIYHGGQDYAADFQSSIDD
ncbi:type II toxin-antitoxin system RelE/ParE family toxin [Burkholderia sp. Cy-637]|uniref:type II toxin-antitoxin system RelE/ParE family toxin n=1 Tax=Burkholderia sp. Cy-637 TaxID=2608327 RepID=UPI001965167D|nr:type II toxin-antitoxin system RelE/ParE family toxin [Burkholderia sp. Cy-637]